MPDTPAHPPQNAPANSPPNIDPSALHAAYAVMSALRLPASRYTAEQIAKVIAPTIQPRRIVEVFKRQVYRPRIYITDAQAREHFAAISGGRKTLLPADIAALEFFGADVREVADPDPATPISQLFPDQSEP
jgi:hypothetical protein